MLEGGKNEDISNCETREIERRGRTRECIGIHRKKEAINAN
jgi:hypothetical protein